MPALLRTQGRKLRGYLIQLPFGFNLVINRHRP